MNYFLLNVKKISVVALLFCVQFFYGQSYGLINQEIGHIDGYILFSPLESKKTFLIDKCGKVVHQWISKYKPGQSVYLLPNGDLLRSANDSNMAFINAGGVIEKFDWNNNLIWSYKISDSLNCLHHDIWPMPNGNILAIKWEKKTKQDAIEHGRNPEMVGNCVWNEKIIELKPIGKNQAEIVWYWDVWENLVQNVDVKLPNYGEPNKHPEKININYNATKETDWLHFNSVTYNPKTNEILLSNRNFNEIYIIKHTKSSDGKSPILFRWGNALAYNSESKKGQQLFMQHSPQWIERGMKDEGKIILFNNGPSRKGKLYSSVEIISPRKDQKNNYVLDENLKPDWIYCDTLSSTIFYSKNISSAQQINKGHVLICEGATGNFFEIDERNNIVWQFMNPFNGKGLQAQNTVTDLTRTYRCTFFSKSFKGFKHKKLIPKNEFNLKERECVPGVR